jgi:cation diffusion facilitator family transporter
LENAKQTIRVQQWVTATGAFLMLVKFAAYYITGSVAILTDALESIVNVVAGTITLYSLYVAARPRDEDHPYGHGKAEFLSAGVEGTLIALAGIWILVEAVQKLLHPSELKQLDYGIILIAAAGLVNFIAGRIAISTGKKNKSLGITATGKHLVSDAVSTAGLVVGLLLLRLTDILWLDSVIALIFGTIIIYTGIQIVRSSVAGIMDEADTELLGQMVKLLNENRRPAWIDLHNLRVIKFGSKLHVDCHVTMPWYYNMHEAHEEIDALSRLITGHFGNTVEMFVHTDGCLPFSCRLCAMDDCPKRKFPFHHTINWTIENIFENKKHELH